MPRTSKYRLNQLALRLTLSFLCALSTSMNLRASKHETPNPGFVTEYAAPNDDVLQALQAVVQDQIVHGTSMYERDRALGGASAAQSSPLFSPWKDGGNVFYKVRTDAIAPSHFRDSADQGTIAVRYVVTSVTPKRTRLRIDAVFVETARRTVHLSDGNVESSENKEIQDHLQAIQVAEQAAADDQRRQENLELGKQVFLRRREEETARLAAAQSSVKDLEQQVQSLRRQVEERVKAPGADLKAAPFRSAATIATLTAYTELVIVVVTPHWHGVETQNGQRGWLPLDQVENLR